MPVLETPSRVWRRIQAAEDLAVPSLPSLPAIDDDDLDLDESSNILIVQPTPSASISGKRSTTVRFAETHESFEFSDIQPIRHDSILTDDDDKLPADYSISLHSENKPSPLDTTKNTVLRTRTPSLTRSASLASTSPDLTPSSDASLSFPNASKRSSTSFQHQSRREQEPSISEDKEQETEKSKQSISTTERSKQSIPTIERSKSSISSTERSKSSISTTGTPSRVVFESSQRQQSQHDQSSVAQVDFDATPVVRKRSFLIDVIQSAAKPRPRLSLHTPLSSQKTQQKQPSFLVQTPLRLTTPKSGVNDSFISTASSHDLAVHQPNVNASFDHLIGAKGVGRFNATKLNTYLHGLNRRLVEENEELTTRLRLTQAQQPSTIMEGDESVRALEVEALEAKVKELEAQLEAERHDKLQEKDKFKEKVQEVERGVNEVVEKLELELETMSIAKEQATVKARRAEEFKEDAEERALRAELALEKMTKATNSFGRRTSSGSPGLSAIGTTEHEEFKEAIERVAQLETDLRISMNRCQRLEDELKSADEALEEARIEKQASEKRSNGMKKRAEDLMTESEELQQRVEELEEDLRGAQEHADGLLLELGNAQEATASAQAQAETANLDAEALHERVATLEAQVERANWDSQQMEEALEAGEAKILQDQQELEALRAEVERLRLFASTNRSSARASTTTAVSIHSPPSPSMSTSDELQVLEKELDDAHREIGRLQHLLSDSPSRNAIIQVKDAKIEKLELENVALEDRVRTLRVLISKGPGSGNVSFAGLATPKGRAVSMGILSSPAVQNLPSFRAPKTPGGPLKDLSWLQSTVGDSESPYLRQIASLERELAHANENIDDKIDLLDEYGRGVTGLTEKLASAEGRIGYLSGEVKRLERREERRTKRLPKQLNCGTCGGSVDVTVILAAADQSVLPNASLTADPSMNDSMKKVLRQLEKMKSDWSRQKTRLANEKQNLQDAASRLDRDAERANNEQSILSELDQAKRTIAELEEQLQTERSQLKNISAERNRAGNEKHRLASQLERTQADMDSIKDQLQKCKRENYTLEADLRANVIAESQARHLRAKVAENQAAIDQLRHERDNLAESHTTLQRQFSQAAQRAEDLRKNLSSAQADHEDKRHQLDLHVAEIEDLKRQIAWRDEELEYARKMAGDKGDLAGIVYELETELSRVKEDAEAFEQDLRALREQNYDRKLGRHEESARAERMQMQLKAEVKILDGQIEEQRSTMKKLQEELENHVCTTSGSETSLTKLKTQHNKECKGLMVQISYLKNKYLRENTFRLELAYQKQYLLVLLGRTQPHDTRILTAISRKNYPENPTTSSSQRKTLKSFIHTVMFINRVKKASKQWSEQTLAKDRLAVALEDVRRRRASGRQSGLVDV